MLDIRRTICSITYPVEIDQLKRKNTENGRRYETPDGALYPSVTTILSA